LLYAVWGVLPVVICGGAGFAPAALAQDQKEEKKDDKKDEKKDEKKTLELKAARKIEFTTDEGTWLSLDISPDGGTIVFELLGDIYTLPVEGGQAKLISGGIPFDSQPRFSPDGKWIAFLSDRDGGENVWIMKPDGGDPKQLSKETWADFASPSWTPDSNYVLVSKTREALATYELWMYHLQGGSGVQITKAKAAPKQPRRERANALGVVASPDGKYLYYARRTGAFAYNAQFPKLPAAIARPVTRTFSWNSCAAVSAPCFRRMESSCCT
jgi:Tol biopolymer transport system component